MSAYYSLEALPPDRVSIGDLIGVDGRARDPRQYIKAKVGDPGPLVASIEENGTVHDLFFGPYSVPIARSLFADRLVKVTGTSEAQVVPLDVMGTTCVIVNVLKSADCISHEASAIQYWPSGGSRPEMEGKIRMITRLVLAGGRIPEGVDLFRPEGWLIRLIVSSRVAMLLEGKEGIRLSELEQV